MASLHRACTALVAGSTRSTYVLTSADVGARIAVSVTATNAAGSAVAESAPPAAVAPVAPDNITRQAITGVAADGELLSTSLGRWTGTQPMDFEYQWRRCDLEGERCTVIEGAEGPTHRLTALDIGSTLRSRVFATNVAGTAMRSSLQTAPVEAIGLESVEPPAVSES